MAYVNGNPKSKVEIKRKLAEGRRLTVFQPGLGTVPVNGTIAIEGPHGVHKWYGTATMKDGYIVGVK